jgi:hypothetical protein
MSDPNAVVPVPSAGVPAGWYPQEGQQRYWDGAAWTDHYAPLVAAVAAPAATTTLAAGWYDDGSGRQRWWDGNAWTSHFAPATTGAPAGRTANGMSVSYVRPQTGHSLVKHLLLGWLILYIDVIYISVSPNHYWHA